MFGIKQDRSKELEEQLAECRSQLEQAEERLRQIESAQSGCEAHFAAQAAAESEMDKELTRVVSNIYDTIAANDTIRKSVEQLAMDLTHMRGQLTDAEAAQQEGKSRKDAAQRQKERLEAAAKENERFIEPLKILQQVQVDVARETGQAERELQKMREYAKQMSILALNCAIEAGRMGKEASSFIGAAEDIRAFAVSYDQSAAEVQGDMAHMRDFMGKLQQQSAVLAKCVKENHASMTQLAKEFAQPADDAEPASGAGYLERANAMSEKVREIAQGQEAVASLQQQTIKEIESIGTSFMDEQNARKSAEQVFEEIRENTRRTIMDD